MQMRSNLLQTSGLRRYWTIKVKCRSIIMYSQTWLHSLIRKFHPGGTEPKYFSFDQSVVVDNLWNTYYLRFAPMFISTIQHSSIKCSTSSLSLFFPLERGVSPLRWNWNIHKHTSRVCKILWQGFKSILWDHFNETLLASGLHISLSFFYVNWKHHILTLKNMTKKRPKTAKSAVSDALLSKHI